VAGLLNNEQQVKIVVRSIEKLPDSIVSHKNISDIQAFILSISHTEILNI
jgi:hypothetical protein